MIKTDLHTHTIFSDGKYTPEEMVGAAIDLGMDCIGISDHSYTKFDDFGVKPERHSEYLSEIKRLKEKYAGVIEVRCGIEQDFLTDGDISCYDYAIGSVHTVMYKGEYLKIDFDKETFIENAYKFFGGDYIEFSKVYFDTVANIVNKTGADIIGHFDLFSMHNKDNVLFDEGDAGYVKAWSESVDELLKSKRPFEINTSIIYKGKKDHPMPSADIVSYIKEHGGSFVLSSDSHRTETLLYAFDEYEYLV